MKITRIRATDFIQQRISGNSSFHQPRTVMNAKPSSRKQHNLAIKRMTRSICTRAMRIRFVNHRKASG